MIHAESRKHLPHKNGSTKLWSLPSLYRGIYHRVAHKVGCDPSYARQVARGERTSISLSLSRVLQTEIQQTLAFVNVLATTHLSDPAPIPRRPN
jgi:hypothetical protein